MNAKTQERFLVCCCDGVAVTSDCGNGVALLESAACAGDSELVAGVCGDKNRMDCLDKSAPLNFARGCQRGVPTPAPCV